MEITRKTIGQAVVEISRKYPDHDALIHTEAGLRYNYALFSWEVERVARGLIRLGVQKGDRVALWAPNAPEWLVAMLALIRMGAIFVPVDPGAGQEDLRYILDQSDSKAVILLRGTEADEFLDTLLAVKDKLPSLEHTIMIATESHPEGILWAELAGMGEDTSGEALLEREKAVRFEDPVAIMYTSGTTGAPKGVVLDHLGLLNKSLASAERQGLTPKDRLCLFFPLYHMFGNTCIALTGLLRGAALVIPSSSFDPGRALKAVFKEGCTAVYGSPSMIIGLVDHPEFKKKRWKTVTKGTMGGAPCPMELMKRLVEDLGMAGVTIGYGITEASSWITMTHPDDPVALRVSTIGTPLECNQVKIVSLSTGEEVPHKTQGEVCVKGLLMKGYHKMPAATAASIDHEGWFHSGDLGEMDDQGYVKITGRIKDVIVRGGIEIHPAEVEEVLYGMAEVSEVQVFGFTHAKKGQEMAAWVKLKDEADLTLEALARYARRKLGKDKAPNYFKFVAEFPMTRSGKVQKFKLAEMAQREYS